MAHDHDRFRVAPDKKFRLADHDPGDTGRFESKEDGKRHLEKGLERMRELQDRLYAAERVGPAAHLPGHGCRGEGQRDQTRDVRRQPARVPGLLLQGAVPGGAGPRLPVADGPLPSRAGPHRRLQPLALRGGPRGARAPGDPGAAEAARASGERPHLEGALRGHHGLRAPPGPQRHRHPQVLPERLARGAAPAVPGPSRRAGEELEVRGGGRRGAQALGRVHEGLRRGAGGHFHQRRRRGTSSPPTTSGSRGWRWRT